MRPPRPRLLVLGLLVALALALAGAQAAGARATRPAAHAAGAPGRAAQTPPTLQQTLSDAMAAAGGASGAVVVDATTGQTLFALNPDIERNPASVEKLYTTSTALLRLGPDATIPTEVLGYGRLASGGLWQGALYLKGFGDPTLGSPRFDAAAYGTGATLAALANQLVARGIRAVGGRVHGDGSYFDSLIGGPASGYGPSLDIGSPLAALDFDRGVVLPSWRFQRNPAVYAATQLANALRARHVRVTRAVDGRPAPAGATVLATVQSPPLWQLIRLTNDPSDNFFAEMLLKQLGARLGGAGSTAAGAAVVRAQLAQLGLHPQVVDGSGLSRRDWTSPRQVAMLLQAMLTAPTAPQFVQSLPVAGRSGTLADRMRGTDAQNRCSAKTGTLNDASALAGYCHSLGGDMIVFAFLMNNVDMTTWANINRIHTLQDRMTITLARYVAPSASASRR